MWFDVEDFRIRLNWPCHIRYSVVWLISDGEVLSQNCKWRNWIQRYNCASLRAGSGVVLCLYKCPALNATTHHNNNNNNSSSNITTPFTFVLPSRSQDLGRCITHWHVCSSRAASHYGRPSGEAKETDSNTEWIVFSKKFFMTKIRWGLDHSLVFILILCKLPLGACCFFERHFGGRLFWDVGF